MSGISKTAEMGSVLAMVVWGSLVAAAAWLLYDAFVFVVLMPWSVIAIAVGSVLMTRAFSEQDVSAPARVLRVSSLIVGVAASVASVAYFVWWGFAFDAADVGREPPVDLDSWLYPGAVILFALAVFIPGAGWLRRRHVVAREVAGYRQLAMSEEEPDESSYLAALKSRRRRHH